MTVKDIADDILKEEPFAEFQIVLSNGFLMERQVVRNLVKNGNSLENCLNEMVLLAPATELQINVWGKSGSQGGGGKDKIRFKRAHKLLLPKTDKGDELIASNSPKGDEIVAYTSPKGDSFINTTENTQKHTTMQDKDHVSFQVLELKHEMLKHQHDENKAKIVKLEKKVDELHEENKNLLRDNLTKQDKHELALERQKFDADKSANENKESLSGLAGDFLKDPDNIKMLVGFINPKHPMFDKEPQAQLTGADDSAREIKYTTDDTANQVLNDIPRILSQKDGDAIAKVYLLFQKMMSSPEIFGEIIKKYVPELPH